jgi:4-hydroxy-4-methyl-2-oxoglutarate aldolase
MNQTTEENKAILEAYKGLRVADVRDGLDWCGMMHYGTVSSNIMPLFRTIKIGIARTLKYLPFQGPVPFLTGEAYTEWSNNYYNKICTWGFFANIEEGDFLCLDQCGMDVGLIGSNSGLEGIRCGAVGWLSNGGVRDTDELILEKVPFWGTMMSQPMVQGRLIFEAEQVPIHIGGVVIYPGDVIAADGDGAVVVPRRMAFDVAKYARRELDNDKAGRKKLYMEMNMELDSTVL